MPDFQAFLEELSSASPVPGGGSVAALQVAMAASLLVMVGNLTIGKKRYAEVEQQVADLRREATILRNRAEDLARQDEEAYRLVALALRLPRASDEERSTRRQRLQKALQEAVRPPLDIMHAAREVMMLAEALVEIGNTSAISDVGCAALSARAGYRAAQLNVEINLSAIHDEQWVAQIREELADVPDIQAAERRVVDRTREVISGEHG